jgi:PAS domain S-box-containing protein
MQQQLYAQLEEIYGKEFDINTLDEKSIKLINTINNTYKKLHDKNISLEKMLNDSSKNLIETNERLKEKNNLLDNVSNSIIDAIFYKDLEQTYLGCNKNYADFLGIDKDEIIGKKDSDFFDKNTVQTFYMTNKLILEEGEKVEYKHWIKYKGHKFYVLTIKSPLFDNKGNIIGIVGVSRDITKEFKLQQEIDKKNLMLIQQNKLISMGEMIANIAHQWRQPLNLMGLILQKIELYNERKKIPKNDLHKMVEDASFLLNEMSQTIDDFRDFFNPKRLKEKFNINDTIHKSYYILKPQIDKYKIQFKYNTQKNYFLHGYKNEFFQVIINLIKNAIDVLISDKIKNPKIKITIKDIDNYIYISIIDNANGISVSQQDKIFEPYFTTKENGTGLGLYMSKIIIEKHMDGILSVKSDIYGSVFTIKIFKSAIKSNDF